MAGLSDTTQRGDMPTGPELKMRLVRTAGRLLATEPVDALSKAVRPDALAAATSRGRGRPISRPTCYRAWPSRIHTVVDVARYVNDPYTEPDRLTDPRRPTSNPGKGLFDVLVEAADAMYDDRNASSRVGAGAYEVVSPEDAAGDAGLPAEAASILFASQGDLVDSVLRHLVARDGLAFDMVDAVRPAPVVRPALAKLKDLAQTHPRALAAAQAHPPTHPSDAVPFLQELTGWITSALQSPHVDRPEPARIAETLVQLALTGDHGWSGVETILAWVDNVPSTPKGPESTPRARSGQRQRSAVSDITSAHVGPA